LRYALNNPLLYTDPSGEFLDLALFLVGSAILRGVFEADDGQVGNGDWNWKKFWSGSFKGLLQAGGAVLGAYTATGPISLLFNQMQVMFGQIGFGPFNYDMNEKDFGIGYGPFDYNVSENEFDYIFEKGNTPMENVMYGLRTVSFLSSVKSQSGSLFKVDEGKSFVGKAWQLTSRFTWEYIQTRIGMDVYNLYTKLGTTVSSHKGITFLESDKILSAFSIGHVVAYNPDYKGALPHEFGHTIQSRILGPFYIPAIVVPSLASSTIDYWVAQSLFGTYWHEDMPWETWADKLKKTY
jgi:hypothetical protein